VKIGVISDTHDFLDPQVAKIFLGVGHILHAGDLGTNWITFQLEQIAPVTAVRGNTDLGLTFRETETVELAGKQFLIQHIVSAQSPAEKLKFLIARVRPDVVVFGHTHKKFCEMIDGILFFNPGYSGKPKLGAERSVAIFHCGENGIRHEFIPL
jgi:putative phosphoesterase